MSDGSPSKWASPGAARREVETQAALGRVRARDRSTTADALWAGVPFVTCTGDTSDSLMGASAVHGVGLGDLGADDLEGYDRIALRLHSNRRSSILFDSPRFTRQTESVFKEMFDRHTSQSGIAVIGPLLSQERAG